MPGDHEHDWLDLEIITTASWDLSWDLCTTRFVELIVPPSTKSSVCYVPMLGEVSCIEGLIMPAVLSHNISDTVGTTTRSWAVWIVFYSFACFTLCLLRRLRPRRKTGLDMAPRVRRRLLTHLARLDRWKGRGPSRIFINITASNTYLI